MKFISFLVAIAIALSSFVTEADAGKRKRRRGSSVPAELRGGEAAQKRHNRAADSDDLSRLKDRKELQSFIDKGLLVPIGDTDAYYLDSLGGHDSSHADLYRHARPWTKRYLDVRLGAGHAKFGHKFKVTSLVRTEDYQRSICRSGNGAAICGGEWWERSLHLTGATVDISKEGMTGAVKSWLRKQLIRDQKRGLVAVIEEHGAFHVFVRKAYGSAVKKAKKAKKNEKPRGKKPSKKRSRTR